MIAKHESYIHLVVAKKCY